MASPRSAAPRRHWLLTVPVEDDADYRAFSTSSVSDLLRRHKEVTKRLAVSLLSRVATGQTGRATSDVPLRRAASSNKEVGRMLL